MYLRFSGKVINKISITYYRTKGPNHVFIELTSNSIICKVSDREVYILKNGQLLFDLYDYIRNKFSLNRFPKKSYIARLIIKLAETSVSKKLANETTRKFFCLRDFIPRVYSARSFRENRTDS